MTNSVCTGRRLTQRTSVAERLTCLTRTIALVQAYAHVVRWCEHVHILPEARGARASSLAGQFVCSLVDDIREQTPTATVWRDTADGFRWVAWFVYPAYTIVGSWYTHATVMDIVSIHLLDTNNDVCKHMLFAYWLLDRIHHERLQVVKPVLANRVCTSGRLDIEHVRHIFNTIPTSHRDGDDRRRRRES
jgi:hypothetical protein